MVKAWIPKSERKEHMFIDGCCTRNSHRLPQCGRANNPQVNARGQKADEIVKSNLRTEARTRKIPRKKGKQKAALVFAKMIAAICL